MRPLLCAHACSPQLPRLFVRRCSFFLQLTPFNNISTKKKIASTSFFPALFLRDMEKDRRRCAALSGPQRPPPFFNTLSWEDLSQIRDSVSSRLLFKKIFVSTPVFQLLPLSPKTDSLRLLFVVYDRCSEEKVPQYFWFALCFFSFCSRVSQALLSHAADVLYAALKLSVRFRWTVFAHTFQKRPQRTRRSPHASPDEPT